MMAALHKATRTALRRCASEPMCPARARPSSTTPVLTVSTPAQATTDSDSPIHSGPPSATSSGAPPRISG